MNHMVVVDYRDEASGIMRENEDGSGEFSRVHLQPVVRLRAGADRAQALELHHQAHRLCFIARSVNFPVEVTPEIQEAA
jgi:organic hydroperoxide reductase OsmC/OhrA